MKQKTKNKKEITIRRRVGVLGLLVSLAFLCIIGRMFYLQVMRHDYYSSLAANQQLRDTVINAQRGNIYDSNMNVLARSATVWTVAVTPNSISEKNYDAISSFLADELGVDYDTVYGKCGEKSYYSIVKRKVDKPEVDRIQAWMRETGIGGITFTEDTKRYYPNNNLASQVLGFVGTDNSGLYGLESYYESYLAGISGRLFTAVNAQGSNVYYQDEIMTEAQDGYSLVLTVDANIQKILEAALEEACEEHNVHNYACGIIMNVNTGAILAMANKPDFNPNDPLEVTDSKVLEKLAGISDEEEYWKVYSQAQKDQWINRTISDIYEPGSVFKVVTASAALETGTETLDSSFYCSGGYHVTNSITIHCANMNGHGSEDFTHAVINSCNPAFMQMGIELGAETFYDYFRSFGLTEKTGIDLPSETQSIYYTDKTMGIVELASCSFGQSNAISPIQMITAFSAVVNGGYLMQPYIVKEVLDSKGSVVTTTEPTVRRQVISQDISQTMRGILEQVVENSNGANAYVAGFRIGGKSGTAEKLNSDSGEYVASFCAFAPANDPEIACLILLDGAHSYSIYGGVIVAPIVARVMSQVLPYMGVEAVYSEDELANVDVYIPNVSDYSLTNAYASLQKRGLEYMVIGDGTHVVSQYPHAGLSVPKGSVVVLYTEDRTPSMIEMPSCKGYSVSYLKSLFSSLGLNLKINGSSSSYAVAMNQSIPEGTMVEAGTVVTIDFVNTSIND